MLTYLLPVIIILLVIVLLLVVLLIMNYKEKTLYRNKIPYLKRFTLFTCSLFSIKIRHILLSDDADLHSHPWAYMSFILWGGYTEVRADYIDRHNHKVELTRTKYGPGSILFRKAKGYHRLEVEGKRTCWTLVITFKKKHLWGFVDSMGQETVYVPGSDPYVS